MDGYFRRQMQLDEVGESGQRKLLSSRVLVIGAGGLGCPLLLNLASCGVGSITVIDFDNVEFHNLHRQTLYAPGDVGKSKAACAVQFLAERYPNTSFQSTHAMFDAQMAISMVSEADILVDCTDNLQVRYLIDDAARIYQKPWVHASVSKFNLQWALFRPHMGYSYRNVFPVPPNPLFLGQCNSEGILGAVSALAGTMQANLVLNSLLGLDQVDGKINHLNTRTGQSYAMAYEARYVAVPKNAVEMLQYDYVGFCQNFNI